MTKRIVVSLFVAMSCFCALAQRSDIVYDKAGNIYEGYIKSQIPGNNVVVQSYRSTLVVPADKAVVTYHDRFFSQLSEEYSDFFPNAVDSTIVEVATINVNGAQYNNAVVIESGVNYKFVYLDNSEHVLKWNELFKVAHVSRDFNLTSGVNDVLVLKTGERIVGQIQEQNLSNGQIRFKTIEGTSKVYDSASILTLRIEPIDTKTSIMQQVPLCDVITLRNGTSIKGLIISKVLGKSVEMMVTGEEAMRNIPAYEIVSYGKYINTSYVAPKLEKKENKTSCEPDLTVNGEVFDFTSVMEEGGLYYVTCQQDSLDVCAKVNETIVVKMKSAAKTYSVKFYPTVGKKMVFFKLDGSVSRKVVETWPSFKLEQPLPMQINFLNSDGQFIAFECSFSSPGVYVLYIENEPEHCVAFRIK